MPYPNVVLISTDQWRGDCLSVAGHPVVRTPYLDGLARSGTRFTNAYSAHPTCIPARMSLMTGLSGAHHGRVGYQDGVPFDVETTLPGQFRQAGFHTQAIGKMHYWPERGRIGFDDVLLHDGYLHYSRDRRRPADFYDDYLTWLREQAGESAVADYFDDGVNCNSVVARPWGRPEHLHPTNWVVTEATRWLYRRDPTVPFFLYLSFHRPHPPYNPPQWAFEQYRDAPDHRPPVGDWTEVFAQHRDDARPDAKVARYDQVTINRARAGYYGNITHIDHQIQRFLEILGEFGLAENTLLCFTSDHGEMLGDHDMWRKGYPYEGSASVPLIMAGPGVGAGQVRDDVVELRDIMPTLLGAAGVQVPEQLDGVDLSSGGTWTESSEPVRDYLHGEHTMLGESMQWIRTPGWKYVWLSGSGHEQLFDMAGDRAERIDRARDPECAHVLQECRRALIDELTGRQEGYVRDGVLVPGREPLNVLDGAGAQPRGVPQQPSRHIGAAY